MIFLLPAAVSTESEHHIIKIYLVAIELRPVDTDESGFSAHQYPAAAAHAGSVDHYGVE